jgi:hypothetical protein
MISYYRLAHLIVQLHQAILLFLETNDRRALATALPAHPILLHLHLTVPLHRVILLYLFAKFRQVLHTPLHLLVTHLYFAILQSRLAHPTVRHLLVIHLYII